MSIHRNYWLVVGRMCGDDEDTALQFEHCTRDQAIMLFKDVLWKDELIEAENADAFGGRTKFEYREQMEADAEGVFINGVFASDSPIEEQL